MNDMNDSGIMLLIGTLLGGVLLLFGVVAGAYLAHRLSRGLAPLPRVADLLPTPIEDDDDEEPTAAQTPVPPAEPVVASTLIRF